MFFRVASSCLSVTTALSGGDFLAMRIGCRGGLAAKNPALWSGTQTTRKSRAAKRRKRRKRAFLVLRSFAPFCGQVALENFSRLLKVRPKRTHRSEAGGGHGHYFAAGATPATSLSNSAAIFAAKSDPIR